MSSLNGGYAMIKFNSTQEELQIAYRSKRPVLFYDENQRSHWAVIEETATESIDEETQEPITLYKYSYRLLDEESGGKSYLHKILATFNLVAYGTAGYISLLITNSNNAPIGMEFFRNTLGYDTVNKLCYTTGFIDSSNSSTSYKDKYIVIGFYITSGWKLGLKLLTLSDLSIINVDSYYSNIIDTVTEV